MVHADDPIHARLREIYNEVDRIGLTSAEDAVRAYLQLPELIEQTRLYRVFREIVDPPDITDAIEQRYGDSLRGLLENWQMRDVDNAMGGYSTRGQALLDVLMRGPNPVMREYEEGRIPGLGILVTNEGRAFGIRAGWFDTSPTWHEGGIPFAPVLSKCLADAAGPPWRTFVSGGHVEGGVTALMRKYGWEEAALFLNLIAPCGRGTSVGCWPALPTMLQDTTVLSVFGRVGNAHPLFIGNRDIPVGG